MISQAEYTSLRLKYDTHIAAFRKLGRNYSTPEDNLPEGTTSDETSSIEVYGFITDPPQKYFGYINEEKKILTTWTGEKLGDIYSYTPYKCSSTFYCFTERVAISVRAINGKSYYGTYYKSSGDYCRLTMYK